MSPSPESTGASVHTDSSTSSARAGWARSGSRDQLEPVKRRVALKVIKAGMDTKQVIARFEAERQALALMDHPAIAKVLDGGATPEGRPYFVMEYVPGVSLTEHCDAHRLPTQQRLELFIEVCEGVQHAHQKAIIHRDLKPSNILVSLRRRAGAAEDHRLRHREGDGAAPHGKDVLDRGRRGDRNARVHESGAGGPDGSGRRHPDGHVLARRHPVPAPHGGAAVRFRGASILQLRGTSPEAAGSGSARDRARGSRRSGRARMRRANGKTEPGSLRRQLEGDLDAIVMKALEKDRARRYGSASDLSADIARFLSHEPVLARPTGGLYRVGKYVRRHRLGVAIAATGVLLLAAFSTAMSVQALRIRRERDRANAERDRATTWFQHAREFLPPPRHDHTSDMKGEVPEVAKTLDALLWKARAELDEKRFAEAKKLLEDTLHFEKMIGEEEFRSWTIGQLGEARMELGQLDAARTLLEEERARTSASKPNEEPDAYLTWTLGRVLARMGDQAGALRMIGTVRDDRLGPTVELPMYGTLKQMKNAPEIAALRKDPRIDEIFTFHGEQLRIEALFERYPTLPPFSPGMKEVLGKTEPIDAGLRWISRYVPPGPPPFDRGPSTKEQDRTLQVCRALYTFEAPNGSLRRALVIGKTWDGRDKCAVPISGFEIYVERYERLLGPAGAWKQGKHHSYPAHSLVGGYSDDGTPYLICQGRTSDDAAHPGTLRADGKSNCRFGYGFKELERDQYLVLTTDDPRLPSTGAKSHRPD